MIEGIVHSKNYFNKELKNFTFRFFVAFIFVAFFQNCYPFSQDYLMGYVACIISDCIPEEELDFYIKNESLHIRLLKRSLDSLTKEKLMQRLKKTNFFKKIDITVAYVHNSSDAIKASFPLNSQVSKPSHEVLPAGTIYDSPIADPKWPRFSAGYSNHFKKTYGRSIFNLSFGENLPLLRYRTDGWSYELGLQAGVFGLMDIGSSPSRLINSDYFVGGAYP